MTQYWAIAVGINQYAHLQSSLMYAERDAAALYRYWLDEAKLEPDHCRLITGASAGEISGQESDLGLASDGSDDYAMPTQAAIYDAIASVAPQTSADDVFWFTFSGYGLHRDGEDHLLTVDSDPDNGTKGSSSIALRDLMTRLSNMAAQPVLFLDLKRLGRESDALLGGSTLALAEQHGIPTILSCQPKQISHETLTLRQGLFTAALLESLRQSGVALDQLGQDLRDRLPQLSERHWRPAQTPMIFVPDAVRYQLLAPGKPDQMPLPDDDGLNDGLNNGLNNGPNNKQSQDPESRAESSAASPGLDLPNLPSPLVQRGSPPSLPSVPTAPAPTPQITPQLTSQTAPSPGAEPVTPQPGVQTAAHTDDILWRRIIPWSAALLILLIFGVVIRNRAALFGNEQSGQREAAQLDVAPLPNGTDTAPPPSIPVDQQVNAEILAQAIASLNQEREETPVNQASDFARAITIAERIQPGQPLYTEAQDYVQRWGNTVVDLAEARAQSGNYVDAIGAANLIPPSVTAVYPRAQERVRQWQQQLGQGLTQRSVIASAQTLIQAGQASSYSQAIAHARLVQPRDVDYDQAQTLIERWSTNILDLAYRRAYGGQFSSAIEAASLVPQDAAVYVDAREAIADWQWQLGLESETDSQIGLLSEPEI